MKIAVMGAPSTGKSVFAKNLAAAMSVDGLSCELVSEYASQYIQQVGSPQKAWEQLVISMGQYLNELDITRDHVVTDAAAFATYIYAQRQVPEHSTDKNWPKNRHLLDVLRRLARLSAQSYDVIFVLTHVFRPTFDGVRLKNHLTIKECQAINAEIELYLQSERMEYHRLKANEQDALNKAMKIIQQRLMINTKK